MEPISKKLTRFINTMHENPESGKTELVIMCFIELWKSNEPILVPIVKDSNGNDHFHTLLANPGDDNKMPLLLTGIDKDGKEINKLIYDEMFLVFFSDEEFYVKEEDVTLMYLSFDDLIQCYAKNKQDFLGIIVNPYHEKYTFLLPSDGIDLIIALN